MDFEYKVIPAPTKGRKMRGFRRPDEKFAYAVQEKMNEMSQLGWEFIRSETLPNTERTGLTRRTTIDRSLLVFRRPLQTAAAQPAPETASVVEVAETVKEAPKPDAENAVDDTVVHMERLVARETETTHAPAAAIETPKPTKLAPAPAPESVRRPPADFDLAKASNPKANPRLEAVSQPDQNPQEPALYPKDINKSEKPSGRSNLPAALRNRASQAQDGA